MVHDPNTWLQTEIKSIDPTARHVLETYSGVPSEEVLPHVIAIRDSAFKIYPWPCIGQFRFARFTLFSYPSYPRILSLLKDDPSAKFLDLGCCFGQDIRKLFIDGVKPDQLVGLDIVPEFNDLGYDLFKDGDKFNFKFVPGDILDDSCPEWASLEGQFDVLLMASFLHIWNWETQVKAASRVATFTKVGSLLVGGGLGTGGEGGEFPDLEGTGTNFRQSEGSFRKLWDEVGEKTDTKWEVKTQFKSTAKATQQNMKSEWAEPNMGMLFFEVTRTA